MLGTWFQEVRICFCDQAEGMRRDGQLGNCDSASVYVYRIPVVVAEPMHPLDDCVGFDWDEANVQKNWERHRITPEEAEEVFFNEPFVVRSDIRHSQREKRYYAHGQTSLDRYLFVAVTIRRNLIRVISVREMIRKEQEFYGKR